MNVFQAVSIGLGVLLVLSMFWQPLKDKVVNLFKSNVSQPEEESLPDLVGLWKRLVDECERRRLSKAASEIRKVFPLLVATDDENQGE